jgi:hypothetical protein
MPMVRSPETITKVKRFRVQSSGLKNSQPTPIKGISLHVLITPFTQWVKSGIPDLDQCIMPFQEVVTFEPGTWNRSLLYKSARTSLKVKSN